MKRGFIFLFLALTLVFNAAFTAAAEGGNTMMNRPITEIPTGDSAACEHPGQIVRLDYATSAEDKYAYVYLPYDYSEEKQYDILYVMHGGGGSQASLFGSTNGNDFKNAVDHLI